jgi:hypothetical protein
MQRMASRLDGRCVSENLTAVPAGPSVPALVSIPRVRLAPGDFYILVMAVSSTFKNPQRDGDSVITVPKYDKSVLLTYRNLCNAEARRNVIRGNIRA